MISYRVDNKLCFDKPVLSMIVMEELRKSPRHGVLIWFEHRGYVVWSERVQNIRELYEALKKREPYNATA